MNAKKGSSTVISRRDFVKATGAILFVAGTGGCSFFIPDDSPTSTSTPAPTSTSESGGILVTPEAIPPADGYLLVDVEKCQGCLSCMLACSLIHEGVESPSLARIQIIQDSLAPFPYDLTIEQCRQCVEPACVQGCPTGALGVDTTQGNLRIVDRKACIGCGACFDACPYTPSRVFLVADDTFGGEAKSRKCDLCANAPYHWDAVGGSRDGKQACVQVCPVGAILFTAEIPKQDGDTGYKVNLRGSNWGRLGYPTS